MAKAGEDGGEAQIAASERAAGKHAARSLRAAGGVPVVLYGHGEPVALALSAREVLAIQHMPRNHVFPLRAGAGKAENVRLVAVQREATSGRILHLDLERVVRGERSRAPVAVVVEGEEALARREAVLTRLVDSLEVEGETMHLPSSVSVDVSALEPGARVSAGEIALPPGVNLVTPPDTAVLQVGHARAAAVEAPEEAGEGQPEAAEADADKS